MKTNYFPTFSILIETANLSMADLEGLTECLKTLQNQEYSPVNAREVLLLDNGSVEPALLNQMGQPYSWLRIQKVSSNMGYHEVKKEGMLRTTGEVVVLADSDCRYEPQWLWSLLKPFSENPEIGIVAGETTVATQNPYGLAMGLVYIFPPFSYKTILYEADNYLLNSVAFRRKVLEKCPLPTDLSIYRGNCLIHARQLREQGYSIWKQPLARAIHACPNGIGHFVDRFFKLGSDAWRIQRFLPSGLSKKNKANVWKLRLFEFRGRFEILFSRNREKMFKLILALPIAAAAVFFFLTGTAVAVVKTSLNKHE